MVGQLPRNACVLALASAMASTAFAQTQPSWNRQVEAIAVTPSSTGGLEIRAVFSVDAADLSTALDLSTEVLVHVNGVLIDLQTFDLTADSALLGGCADLNCGSEPCICTDPPAVVCECGPMVITSGAVPATLQPKDYIEVLLRPAPGAMPESDPSDDLLGIGYDGDPLLWERRLTSVQLQPSGGPAGDQFFDIWIEPEVAANYQGPLNLGSEYEILLNGTSVGTFPSAMLGDLFWDQCLSGCGTSCVMDATGGFWGTCQDDPDFPIPCSCQYQPVPDIIGPLQAQPGDEIMVLLRPVPGALPELPGFDDELAIAVFVPVPCPADTDGSGDVGITDLLGLLAAWGTNNPTYDLAPAGGDGIVDILDLLAMLSAWGPCV